MKILQLIFVISLIAFTTSVYAQQTGEFILKSSSFELLGEAAAKNNEYIDQNDVLSWEVYIPANYDENNPPGLFIFSGSYGKIPPGDYSGEPMYTSAPKGWRSVMEDKNLIWVAPRKSGNGATVQQKVIQSVLSIHLIKKKYKIDSKRIYVSGHGRTSARVALNHPELISGVIFSGGNLWESDTEEKLKHSKNQRFVFQARVWSVGTPKYRAYKRFKAAGLNNVIWFVREMSRRNFARMIDFLDGEELPKKYTKE